MGAIEDRINQLGHALPGQSSPGGNYVPAVTSILDSTIAKQRFLMPWAVKMGAEWFEDNHETFAQGELSVKEMVSGIKKAYKQKSSGAIAIGKVVHEWCEQAILWKLGEAEPPAVPEDELAANSINAFREWVKLNDVEWLTVEEKVYHRDHKYAGTLDATAVVNDEYCVIDFKTSAAIYSSYYLQCAAYAKAIEDMRGKSVDKAYILRFDKKTGEFEAGSSIEIQENFMGFLGFLDGYRRLKDLENRK